jgi:hypothetical protein
MRGPLQLSVETLFMSPVKGDSIDENRIPYPGITYNDHTTFTESGNLSAVRRLYEWRRSVFGGKG